MSQGRRPDVTEVAQFETLPAALLLLDGHEIAQGLARVSLVGQGVDYRVTHVGGELFDDLLAERPDEQSITVAIDDARRVADRLAAAGLHLVGAHVEGLAPELADTRLETQPGSRRELLEDQCHCFAA